MRNSCSSPSRSLFIAVLLLLAAGIAPLLADDVLFIGNSFTFVNDVPALVEAIATSKGKTIATMKVTKGGQGWDYHLAQQATNDAFKSKAWNWIVLQDYSTNATHAAKAKGPDAFTKNGEALYDLIAKASPGSGIVLYETWAYSPKHPAISGTAGKPGQFASPDEMYGEIHKNYAALQTDLQAKDPNRKVLIAPVGTAFFRCAHDHPEINLYAKDFKHPNLEGSYLAALVIYSTLTGDSPTNAADAAKSDPKIDKVLREIAAAVVGLK